MRTQRPLFISQKRTVWSYLRILAAVSAGQKMRKDAVRRHDFVQLRALECKWYTAPLRGEQETAGAPKRRGPVEDKYPPVISRSFPRAILCRTLGQSAAGIGDSSSL